MVGFVDAPDDSRDPDPGRDSSELELTLLPLLTGGAGTAAASAFFLTSAACERAFDHRNPQALQRVLGPVAVKNNLGQ